jgi:hypothetical protein
MVQQISRDTRAKMQATVALNAMMKNAPVKNKGINQRQLWAITEASSEEKPHAGKQ